MPRRTSTRRRSLRGGSFGDWVKGAIKFLRGSKIISKGLSAYSKRPGSHPGWSVGAQIANTLGFGQPRLKGSGRRSHRSMNSASRFYTGPALNAVGAGRY